MHVYFTAFRAIPVLNFGLDHSGSGLFNYVPVSPEGVVPVSSSPGSSEAKRSSTIERLISRASRWESRAWAWALGAWGGGGSGS